MCYQCDNRWYIEGLNKRHIRNMTYIVYDSNGVFKFNSDYQRIIKTVRPTPTPQITQIAPYKDVTINETKTAPELSEAVVHEKNNGWAIVTGVKGELYSSAWMAQGIEPRCFHPDYNVRIAHQGILDGNNDATYPVNGNYISLREKLYYYKNDKIKISFELKLIYDSAPGDLNLWKNPFKYEIVYNGAVLFSNYYTLIPGDIVENREQLIFDNSGSAKIEIETILMAEGLIDIKLFQPTGSYSNTKIKAYEIVDMKIETIGFNENITETDLINGEFTVNKSVDLTYCDDRAGYVNSFRLEKLNMQGSIVDWKSIPILYKFQVEGKFYNVVALDGANLIFQNKDQVYWLEVLGIYPLPIIPHKIEVNNVFFNFNHGEQMVVETKELYEHDIFDVKKANVKDVVVTREQWTQWTDSVYKIENFPYAKTVANIYRRMFNEAHEKIDMDCLNAVKFNDIIQFHYVYDKEFYLLNCSWNMDLNKSTITVGRSHYKDASSTGPDKNIPPIVVACDDVYIHDGETTVDLTATAYDPDGVIFSQIWEKTSGGFGDIIDSPNALNTKIENITGDYYTYKITVTDNDGATAEDTVNVIRIKDHTITLDLVGNNTDESWDPDHHLYDVHGYRLYKLNISPALLPGDSIVLNGLIQISLNGASHDSTVMYNITKNGNVIETNKIAEKVNYSGAGTQILTSPITLSVISTDAIYIYFDFKSKSYGPEAYISSFSYLDSWVQINTSNVTAGNANILGLPISHADSQHYQYP